MLVFFTLDNTYYFQISILFSVIFQDSLFGFSNYVVFHSIMFDCIVYQKLLLFIVAVIYSIAVNYVAFPFKFMLQYHNHCVFILFSHNLLFKWNTCLCYTLLISMAISLVISLVIFQFIILIINALFLSSWLFIGSVKFSFSFSVCINLSHI